MTKPESPEMLVAIGRSMLVAIGRSIDDILNGPDKPKTTAYFVLLFPFGATEYNGNYVTNANREDLLRTLKELIARIEEPGPNRKEPLNA